MTINEFMDKLAGTRDLGEWAEIGQSGHCEIRCRLRGPKTGAFVECCPLTAVWLKEQGRYLAPEEAYNVAADLGIVLCDADLIVNAADDCMSAEQVETHGWVRDRMFDAVGLTP